MEIDRRFLVLGLSSTALLGACETTNLPIGLPSGFGLSQADAALGIKAALNNGVDHAIGKIGILDGFWQNGRVKIPLPNTLNDIRSALAIVGADGILNELHQQLNRGAEKAVPVAKKIFVDAITSLSISDAINIVKGPDDAATTYLRDTTSASLANLFSPIMKDALGQTGALRLLDDVTSQLRSIPLAPQLGADARRDLIGHGVDFGLKGLFTYVADEEKAIRDNPAKRTSEILRKVFGAV
ncbi:MAG: DUF4197 domain-containing protein [Hellea sp.]|nr:DUF4197 domain-containing protein [Hellea sp.]